jgi:hypothetical protein
MNEYVEKVREREEYWRRRVERERRRRGAWEEGLKVVIKEGEMLERELRRRRGRKGRGLATGVWEEGMGTVRAKAPPLPPPKDDGEYFPPTPAPSTTTPTASEPVVEEVLTPTPASERDRAVAIIIPADPDTEEEDEFFDAIEFNQLPNLTIPSSLLTTTSSPPLPLHFDPAPFMGYRALRSKLEIGTDTRPSTSLWSVLKHSIGKDLTKISFPVFFNEPSSMLQRMVSSPRPPPLFFFRWR